MDRSKARATSVVPDRVLIHAVRWVPAMMLGGFGAIAWAVFGQASAGWWLVRDGDAST